MKVYVASSWRNPIQPAVVSLLQTKGFEVYDFRHPANNKEGFKWSDLGIERPEDWTPEQCIQFLQHPLSRDGFKQDFDAMLWADACVLVLPAGRSANLEAGWFAGKGKRLVVLKDAGNPDLMYLMADVIVASVEKIPEALMPTEDALSSE
jgi:hypothetical protein